VVLLQLDVELPLSSVTSLNFHCSGTDSWLSGFITSAFGYGSECVPVYLQVNVAM
jgi:hypothetical protein